MVTSLLDQSKDIIRQIKDGNGKRKFKLGLIVTMSCHPLYSNIKVSSYFSSLTHFSSCNHTNYFSLPIEQNPPNPPQQETPIPCMPCDQTPWQPTTGPGGTQWLEDLFHEPSQHNEPPIPGTSQSSKSQVPSHEDTSTGDPEPEMALTQSMEEPFVCPLAPPSTPTPEIPTTSSPHSHNEAGQEFTNLKPTLMIPQEIVHDIINQVLLEHCQLLHMIPVVDATHRNEMHQQFWEELNSLLGQVLEAYPKEDITRIVSRFLKKNHIIFTYLLL
ncbi:hypothetical protein O181_039156 [Austropuccinia psidii MF-1]|uniref:Uncharacterized protein n=1 Tax=Austropuccinia psidii MF-1 TaxID=1389203 RepID=A0A9Q3D980_9BASI|nr:hypothetical protein [Austropuccinia psidii MF-1]